MDFQTLNLLFRCSKDFNHEKIRLHELTETEFMLCSYVYAQEGCSQEDAVRALRMDKTTAGKALQKLEDKGLIRRVQGTADKRKKCLYLTAEGAEELSDIMGLHDRWMNSVLGCLSPEEQVQFENYCVRLLTAAEALLNEKPTED